MAHSSITMKEIANICGVSVATVSRVVNKRMDGVSEKTFQRINSTIAKYRYRPSDIARSMVTKRSSTIGLVIPDIRNPFFSELARGVEDVCQDNSYGCYLCNTDGNTNKENEYIGSLRGRAADGVIFTTQNTNDSNVSFIDMQREKYPFCLVDRYMEGPEAIPGVYFDNEDGARQITEFILSRGHRSIAIICGPQITRNAVQRLEGCKKAMAQAGIAFQPQLIVEGNYRYTGGYEAMDELLRRAVPKKDFTAVLAANDLMALGAYKRLKEAGISMPGEVSLAGFDHIVFPDIMEPSLTTVEVPAYEAGRKAAEILFSLLREEVIETRHVAIKARVIDQGSVGFVVNNH